MTGSAGERPVSAVSTRNGRAAFILGGSLFIASAVFGVVLQPLLPFGAPIYYALGDAFFVVQQLVKISAAALFAAGVIVFAVGIRREGSVVGRRRIGVVALSLFALWPLAMMLLFLVPATIWGAMPAWGSYALAWAAPFVAGLIGVILIVRARTVPGGWRWLPLGAFLFVAGSSVAYPVVMALAPATDAYAPIYMIPVIFAIYGGIVASLLLGLVAIGLAGFARNRAKSAGAAAPAESFAVSPTESAEPAT